MPLPAPAPPTALARCMSCRVDLPGTASGAAELRAFFARHGDCLTSVDLDRCRAAVHARG